MSEVQGDRMLGVHEPPGDLTPGGKTMSSSNAEAGIEEIDIARIEKIYRYVIFVTLSRNEAHKVL
jgi:hypothetical protein